MQSGIVIKHTGSNYTVYNSFNKINTVCFVRGKLRLSESKSTNPIAVGDHVLYNADEKIIEEILPRKNYIIRRSSNLSRQSHVLAANIDMLFLVVTLDFPKTNFEFIDRFLVTAEAYKIPACLVLNKVDLYTTEELKDLVTYFHYVYTNAGYPIIEISALNQTGIGAIKNMIPDKINLFAGNSGVGKSTLINALSQLNLKTSSISQANNKGTHTTTFYEMFETCGGFIIDSPGIKGFGLVEIDKTEINHYFPEIFKISSNCKFGMCTHTHEPGCAVKQALEERVITESRYYSYLKMLDDDGNKYR